MGRPPSGAKNNEERFRADLQHYREKNSVDKRGQDPMGFNQVV